MIRYFCLTHRWNSNRYNQPGSNDNEGIHYIPQSSSITGASPSHSFVSYQGHSFAGGSCPSAEIQSMHSTVPVDRAVLTKILGRFKVVGTTKINTVFNLYPRHCIFFFFFFFLLEGTILLSCRSCSQPIYSSLTRRETLTANTNKLIPFSLKQHLLSILMFPQNDDI